MSRIGLVAVALAVLTVLIGLVLIFYTRGGIPVGDQVFALLLYSFVSFAALALLFVVLWSLELQKFVVMTRQGPA